MGEKELESQPIFSGEGSCIGSRKTASTCERDAALGTGAVEVSSSPASTDSKGEVSSERDGTFTYQKLGEKERSDHDDTATPTAVGAPDGVMSPVCASCHQRHPQQKTSYFCNEGRQGFFESILAMTTLGLVCSCCYFMVAAMILLALHSLVFRNIYTSGVFVCLVANCMWPLDNSCVPRASIVDSWVFRVWRRYFHWQCVVEAPLDPNRRYMFAEMPHGVMPVGQLLSTSVVQHAFPGSKYTAGVAADAVLRIPLMRTLYALLGIRRAGRQSILNMLDENINVAVVVGGIAEMFMVSREVETIYLKKRKNFTKIAVEAGADIVPVYFYGNTLLHDLLGGEGSSNWLYRLSRKLKMALVVFYGRCGTPIPRRRQLKMVAGRPIGVRQSNEPSEEYVDALHSELVERVRELYYNHRPEWETRDLVIV